MRKVLVPYGKRWANNEFGTQVTMVMHWGEKHVQKTKIGLSSVGYTDLKAFQRHTLFGVQKQVSFCMDISVQFKTI